MVKIPNKHFVFATGEVLKSRMEYFEIKKVKRGLLLFLKRKISKFFQSKTIFLVDQKGSKNKCLIVSALKISHFVQNKARIFRLKEKKILFRLFDCKNSHFGFDSSANF